MGLVFAGSYGYQHFKVRHEAKQAQVLQKQVVKKKAAQEKQNMPAEGNITINWQKLHKINPDIKAWIYIPHTHINFSILQYKDNEYYLHHNQDKKYAVSGEIFMDYRNKANFLNKNTFIYGHYMYNKMKFADLNHYFDSNYFNEHKHIYIYTPKKRYVGTAFAVQSNSGTSKAHTMHYKNQEEFTDYVNYLKSRSDVKTKLKTKDIKHMVTLWTCSEDATIDDAGNNVSKDKARTFVSVSLKEAK